MRNIARSRKVHPLYVREEDLLYKLVKAGTKRSAKW